MTRPLAPRRLLGLAALVVIASSLGSTVGVGCTTPLPGDDVCQDVGYSISNKVFECNGDVAASNDAYERFMAAHPCKISDLPTEDEILEGRISDPPYDVVGQRYECSAAILRLTCEQAAAVGGDYDTFLAASGACDRIFARTGTGTLPSAPVGPGGGNGGAGGAAPKGPSVASMTLDVTWENTSFVGACTPQAEGFVYACGVPNGERRAQVTITLENFRQGNLQGPILLQGTVSLLLQLDGTSGSFTYDPQAHPDDRPFSWSLKDDDPADKTFRSFTVNLEMSHPTSDASFPAFGARATLVVKNRPCPAKACD